MNIKSISRTSGFTIVELLIVIVVIAILAAITIVGYNGISSRAKESALKSDLSSGAKQVQVEKLTAGAYPVSASGIDKSDTTDFQYTYNNAAETFCLSASSGDLVGVVYYITEAGNIESGDCPTPIMQTISSATCTDSRTRVVDARDNHTYWIQKLADGNCWMLTNLAYSGGGTNTYGDVKSLNDSTSGAVSYTTADYQVVPSTANYTTDPTNPSTSADGTGQYGYLYNWCGAMGGQATAACASATTPAPVVATTICPSGWRLPTGNGGEFNALNAAINGGLTNTDTGTLSNWLGQLSGRWYNSFYWQGAEGHYWSSTQSGASSAYSLGFHDTNVSAYDNSYKTESAAVRCMAI